MSSRRRPGFSGRRALPGARGISRGAGDRHLLLRLVLDVRVRDLESFRLGGLAGLLPGRRLLDLLQLVVELGLQLGFKNGGTGQL